MTDGERSSVVATGTFAMIYYQISDIIGNTPLINLPVAGSGWRLLLKLEKFNPGGSMKDRMAIRMITKAEEDGLLKPGGTIIESSSGNTGVGLAMLAASRGYRFIAIVDHHAAKTKISTMKAYGAQIVYADGDYDEGELAVTARESLAARLANETPNSFWTHQSSNPANPDGYACSLAFELAESYEKDVDVFIAAVGTGGTISGTATQLKKLLSAGKPYVIGVEPVGSIIFGGQGGHYYQSGTGNPPGVEIAANVDYSVIDDHIKVTDAEAFTTARWFARNRGMLLGGSSGGVLYAILSYLHELPGSGTAVALLADGGEKYLDTIYDDEWITEHDLFSERVDEFLYRLFRSSNQYSEVCL